MTRQISGRIHIRVKFPYKRKRNVRWLGRVFRKNPDAVVVFNVLQPGDKRLRLLYPVTRAERRSNPERPTFEKPVCKGCFERLYRK